MPTQPHQNPPPFSIANYSLLITNYSLAKPFTFSAKEKDSETDLNYFGSRYYNSDLSIWLSVDPMASKYPSFSPYTYCANNPIKLVDPNGDSCAVLLAEKAVYGVGHMAILIQNKENRWELYSKNGDSKTIFNQEVGTPDDQPCLDNNDGSVKNWDSVQEFLDDHDYNTVNHDGKGGIYYTDAYILPTSPQQDDIIREGMNKKLDETYNFFRNNCSQAVVYSLRKAGINLFTPAVGDPMNFSGHEPISVGKGTIPLEAFEKIQLLNPGNMIYHPKSM